MLLSTIHTLETLTDLEALIVSLILRFCFTLNRIVINESLTRLRAHKHPQLNGQLVLVRIRHSSEKV